ncbi:hypothetical protein GCK72_022629 [Caenorhabditis remanei]|uniref:Sdz-33 F-box domain-containing protein n=1 Tax=Caenorhabditis remanei TaxID=31234 RepID=A0A6A5FUJ9_CAERE|nr:hypothetical protein GCK72_022629 [Caenorhabditis remanei]KAF1746176.1 hypothetical protein GCK72_022629 [Caenorhabditis remanei]
MWSWNNLPISTSELLNKTFDVFHCKLIDQVHLMDTPQYNMSLIIATLPNIKKVSSFLDITNEINSRALKALLPKTSRVTLYPEAEYNNPEKLQETLIENLDYIEIIAFGRDFRLNLDDVLITNATEAYFYGVSLREQDLNRLLKLWITGKFNTRMEHLRFALQEEFNRDNILNGLNAIELPRTTTRTFEFPTSQTISSKTIYGGHDIRRGDGDLITVDILRPGTLYVYDIYFWS